MFPSCDVGCAVRSHGGQSKRRVFMKLQKNVESSCRRQEPNIHLHPALRANVEAGPWVSESRAFALVPV